MSEPRNQQRPLWEPMLPDAVVRDRSYEALFARVRAAVAQRCDTRPAEFGLAALVAAYIRGAGVITDDERRAALPGMAAGLARRYDEIVASAYAAVAGTPEAASA